MEKIDGLIVLAEIWYTDSYYDLGIRLENIVGNFSLKRENKGL